MTYRATFDPGPEHDSTQDFRVNGEWLNTVSQDLFRLDDATPDAAVWTDITGGAPHTHAHVDTTGRTPDDHHAEDHAARHQDGGADELNVGGLSGTLADPQTAAAHNHDAADLTTGTLADARIAESSVTQHQGAISHDALTDFEVGEHRVINDAGTSTTELWSADKIDAELSTLLSGSIRKPGIATSTHDLGDITLSGEQTLNGVTTSASLVLVTEQTLPAENGFYVTAAGAWARASFADEDAEVSNGNLTDVLNTDSTKFGYKYLLVTPDPIVVGTTGQTWEEHRNIALGTTSGTAAEGDDSRIPTQDENDAQVGTSGTPSAANAFVTDADPRNTDARTPTSHGLGGSEHSAATLAELNAKVSDANLDDSGDARPPQAHTIASHSDTTAEGSELDTLTDGSSADALHTHSAPAHTIASHTDTDATGAELNSLTDGSEANGLHTHAPAQLFPWTFSTTTAAADPGGGRSRMNNADPSLVTALYYDDETGDGFQFDNFFGNLVVGEEICGQQEDDSTKTAVFAISGAPTDNTGWWTVPVTFVSANGGLFGNNKSVRWLIRMRF